MHSTVGGVRSGVRVLRRDPGFVALVVLTLAIGIGATTAALNVAASVLFTPLPVETDSRVVVISKKLSGGSALVPYSYGEMAAWREASHTLDAVAGVQYDGATPWTAEFGERAATVAGAAVSGEFFTVLGAQPVVGRLIVTDDARPGSEDVAVIGYGLWRRQFGGNPQIVGQRIRLNGRPATIVGVAPRGFAFPKAVDVWQPLVATPEVINEGWFTLIARLRPQVTVTQASEEASILLDRLRSIAPVGATLNLRASVVLLRDAIVGDVRPVLGLFAGAAALLFLAGCINAMSLLLVRGAARAREIFVRAALGATRWRLIRQLLAEAALFTAVGGALGALVALWLQRALVAAAPAELPRLDEVAFDRRALGFAVAGSLMSVAVAGVVPALWTARLPTLNGRRGVSMYGGGKATGGQIGRQLLVASQLAFALLVTVAAALLVRSLLHLQAAELGFSAARLTVVHVPLVSPAYNDPVRRQQFFEELVARMEAVPEVAAATPVLVGPFAGQGWDATLTVEGQTRDEALANPALHLEAVLPNYFSTMGIPIVRGRAFVRSDRPGGEPVVILSESLARQAWRGSSALGKRVKFGSPESPAPWMTVVGTVGDLRYRDLDALTPAIYVPLGQAAFPPRFLVVRARRDHASILPIANEIVKQMDPEEPVLEAASLADLLARELGPPRFHMLALGLFASVTILLAGIGVFGVLGTYVAQRSRELGVRVALGANARHLHRIVFGTVGWPAAVGLTLGTCAAIATTPLLQPLLFQVSPLDARAFLAAWIVLVLAGAVAALIPLRRASRIDPAALLRTD